MSTTTKNPSNLKPHQLRILQGLSEGKAPKQLAGEMGLTLYSLRWHQYQTFRALGCSTSAHAIAVAFRRKLIN